MQYLGWAHSARVFVIDEPFQPSVGKYSNLLGPYVCYEENLECLSLASLSSLV